MIDPSTHTSLLEQARDLTDRHAWQRLDRIYGPWILRYCRARGLQACDAEDVRQTVLLGLARAVEHFRYRPELGRFRAYLGRCVRHVITRQIRQRRRHTAVPLDGEDALAPPADDALWHREWVRHHFEQAMRRVRDTLDQRSIAIFDALLAGHAIDAVARSHAISTQAVHKVKQRVRDRLRELIRVQIAAEIADATL